MRNMLKDFRRIDLICFGFMRLDRVSMVEAISLGMLVRTGSFGYLSAKNSSSLITITKS